MKMEVDSNPQPRQVKLMAGNELRRFIFMGKTYADFVYEIKQLLGVPVDSKLGLNYQDEEGDYITVGSDIELQLAFNIMKDKIVKFTVSIQQPTAPPPSPFKPNEPFPIPQAPTFSAPPVFPAFPTPAPSAPASDSVNPMTFSPGHQMIYYQHMKEHKPWKTHKREMKHKDKFEKLNEEESIKGKMAARFIGHVTIEDDTPLSPGTSFIKTWRFRNESTYQWPPNTCLICVSKESDKLGGPEVVPVTKQAGPGEEVDVSIPLIAPSRTGRFVCYYRLAGGPKGKKFGQRVRVQIQVI